MTGGFWHLGHAVQAVFYHWNQGQLDLCSFDETLGADAYLHLLGAHISAWHKMYWLTGRV